MMKSYTYQALLRCDCDAISDIGECLPVRLRTPTFVRHHCLASSRMAPLEFLVNTKVKFVLMVNVILAGGSPFFLDLLRVSL